MSLLRRIGYLFALPVILIALWWLKTVLSESYYIPTPPQLVTTFVHTWLGPRLISDILPSVVRLLIGLAVTIVGGVALGVLIGSVRWLRQLLEPLLEFFRAIPPPVLVPLLMLLIGINPQMKVVVIMSGAIWPVLLNTVEGVRATDEVLSDTSRSYGITGIARLRYLIIPGATPQIMTGVRQCLSIGLILMVISEMFGSSSGLGFTIILFQRNFAVPEMWSGIAVLGLIGIGLAFCFQLVEKRMLNWYHGLREVQRDN